jgi:enoyl-CoA hydratase/carnithine racemase
MFERLLYEVADHIATITLYNPEQRNAFGPVMEAELRAALAKAGSDDMVRVIVLTAHGKTFCVGADMSALQDIDDAVLPDPDDYDGNYGHRLTYILATPKPIIAAINGPIAGVGLSIAAYCDFRYMIDTAKLTTSFSRLGLVAEHGMSWMLPRLIGPMNAMDLLMTGRVVTAAEAERLGLVRALPADTFMADVMKFANDLANLSSPRSTSIIKRQVYEGLFQDLGEATGAALLEELKSFECEDFKEGVASFVERRPPAFTGR